MVVNRYVFWPSCVRGVSRLAPSGAARTSLFRQVTSHHPERVRVKGAGREKQFQIGQASQPTSDSMRAGGGFRAAIESRPTLGTNTHAGGEPLRRTAGAARQRELGPEPFAHQHVLAGEPGMPRGLPGTRPPRQTPGGHRVHGPGGKLLEYLVPGARGKAGSNRKLTAAKAPAARETCEVLRLGRLPCQRRRAGGMRRLNGQPENEARAFAHVALHPDAPAMLVNQAARNGQAQPSAATAAPFRKLLELAEDAMQVFFRD